MTLHCTLVGTPQSPFARQPVELSITAPAGTSGAEIHAELVRKFCVGAVSVDGEDLCSMCLGSAPLVAGAVLLDGGSQPLTRKTRRRPAPGPAAPIALAVHSGAGAGILVPLRRGTYTLGRGNTRIVVPDPELSREHARLVVTEKDIMIIDLDSANGTFVDGERVRHAVITTASSLRCGNSAMSLVFLDVPDKALSDAGTSVHEPLTVAGLPDSSNRGILLLTATLPLVIGVGLAVVTGMWMFLAFTAVSAVSVLIPLTAGRRQRRDFETRITLAVEEDRKRRHRSGPSLALLVLATGHGHPAAASAASGNAGLSLRLGQAPQLANLKIQLGSTPRDIPSAGEVPVLVNPANTHITFRGARPVTEAMARSLVMQLAGYPSGSKTRIIICGPPETLPFPARFLPGVTLAASEESCLRALTGGVNPDDGYGVLLLTADLGAEAGLRETARQLGWQILEFRPPDSPAGIVDVELTERQSRLREPGSELTFVPDLAPDDVFSNYCRRLAASPRVLGCAENSVPSVCTLDELMPLSPTATAARWTSSVHAPGLAVPLGLRATGHQVLDLQSDGPHVLVAGTTGSGKSELLRTLVLGLALSHPPDRVNFLLIDFKGGSGLGPLAGLLHCVGTITDLSAHELERTLISLRAEVRLREKALAAAEVPDLAAYRTSPAAQDLALPHLVIVIDEFRMLVDDAPEVLHELMRIASIGRSLGLHLVMATQRPQGALTAEIRANVTSSIALRVQSDMESQDILNTKAAAGISLDTPGRAFIARGMEPPQEFQAASTGRSVQDTELQEAKVQLTTDYLAGMDKGCPASADAADPTPAQAAAPLVAMIHDLWAAQAGTAPRLPVAPPLPEKLTQPEADVAAREAASGETGDLSLKLGLLDVPDQQEIKPLAWNPAVDGHLALIGTPGSGASGALELAAYGLAGHKHEAHCYFLDAGGVFLGLTGHPRTGAHAGLHELRRAVRVLERLREEMTSRLSVADHPGVPLVLVISSWGSWVSAFRAGPLAWAEDLVQEIVRDGTRAGITVIISGEREVVTARFCGSLPNRIYFPTGSNEDSRIAWPRMPSTAAVRGRGVAFGPIAGSGAAVCQLYQPAPATWAHDVTNLATMNPPFKRPFRVEPLPAFISAMDVRAGVLATAGEPGSGEVLLGVAGDELNSVSVRIQPGSVLAVLGGAGSGKTNVLQAIQVLHPGDDRWICPDNGNDPNEFWKVSLEKARAGKLRRAAVLLVDDIDFLAAGALKDLSELHALGHGIIFTANYSPLLLQRVPLLMESRAAGKGLLLSPRSPSEGDLFGVRFDIEPNPPTGRGVLVSRGHSSPIQVAWAGHHGKPQPGGERRYSAGVAPPVREA